MDKNSAVDNCDLFHLIIKILARTSAGSTELLGTHTTTQHDDKVDKMEENPHAVVMQRLPHKGKCHIHTHANGGMIVAECRLCCTHSLPIGRKIYLRCTVHGSKQQISFKSVFSSEPCSSSCFNGQHAEHFAAMHLFKQWRSTNGLKLQFSWESQCMWNKLHLCLLEVLNLIFICCWDKRFYCLKLMKEEWTLLNWSQSPSLSQLSIRIAFKYNTIPP